MGISKNHPAYDRIRGVIFGHAIGDALGFGAEGMAKAEVSSRFEDGLRDYDQIRSSGMRALLRPGKRCAVRALRAFPTGSPAGVYSSAQKQESSAVWSLRFFMMHLQGLIGKTLYHRET